MGLKLGFHLGFTGTSNRLTGLQKEVMRLVIPLAQTKLGRAVLHSGDCIEADAEAHWIATNSNFYTVGHIPDSDRFRAFCKYDEERDSLPYLKRDRNIAKECQCLLATPNQYHEIRRGSGTWATIRYAKEFEKNVVIVFPDGSVKVTGKGESDIISEGLWRLAEAGKISEISLDVSIQ